MWLEILDSLGVFVFSISGVLTAANKKLDYFGATVIAFFTALGGGTIRDLVLQTKVAWVVDTNLILIALFGAVVGIVFREKLYKFSGTLFFFDAVGLGTFTILGLQKSLNFGTSEIVAVMLGVTTAAFGGVIRDILCNRIPLIFRKEIYAVAALVGGIFYLFLEYFHLPRQIDVFLGVICVIAIRLLSVRYHWAMPVLKSDKQLKDERQEK